MNNIGASTAYSEAKKVAVEYLQSVDGAGLAAADAIAAANDLLTLDAETTGLLVEKAPGEIGFLHGIFEEYLAGYFASGLDMDAQKGLIAERIGDPNWSNVLLSMLHNLSRPGEIETLVRLALSVAEDQSQAKLSLQLAAEVAFGDFRCPPKYALEIASQVFAAIETGPWPRERQTLLSLVLDLAAVGPLTERLKRKLSEWMPDSIRFRANTYAAMAHWRVDPPLVECLWRGLFDDDAGNRSAAGQALVLVSDKSRVIAERLFDLLCAPIDGEIASSALSTLFLGWPNYPGLGAVMAQAKNSPVRALATMAVHCDVRSGTKSQDNLETLLSLADSRQYLFASYSGKIVEALVEGWPDSDRLHHLAFRSLKENSSERELDRDIAKAYLLATSKLNPQWDRALAGIVREDEFFFGLGGIRPRGDDVGPEVRAAMDDRLVRLERFRSNDIAYLAVATRSTRAKTRLFELLNENGESDFLFWPVWGLLTGWGMQDAEVAAALEPLARQSPEKVQFIAHHLSAILRDNVRCREILLNVARIPNLKRLDFLANGFQRA